MNDSEMDKVFILWWSLDDGSDVGILRVYRSESRANEDFELVKELSHDREWHFTEKRVYPAES